MHQHYDDQQGVITFGLGDTDTRVLSKSSTLVTNREKSSEIMDVYPCSSEPLYDRPNNKLTNVVFLEVNIHIALITHLKKSGNIASHLF